MLASHHACLYLALTNRPFSCCPFLKINQLSWLPMGLHLSHEHAQLSSPVVHFLGYFKCLPQCHWELKSHHLSHQLKLPLTTGPLTVGLSGLCRSLPSATVLFCSKSSIFLIANLGEHLFCWAIQQWAQKIVHISLHTALLWEMEVM